MDDILKILFPELRAVNLKAMLRRYSSSANKVLLDYKQFFRFISNGLKGKFETEGQSQIKPNLLNL